jgi:hypothetical protein
MDMLCGLLEQARGRMACLIAASEPDEEEAAALLLAAPPAALPDALPAALPAAAGPPACRTAVALPAFVAAKEKEDDQSRVRMRGGDEPWRHKTRAPPPRAAPPSAVAPAAPPSAVAPAAFKAAKVKRKRKATPRAPTATELQVAAASAARIAANVAAGITTAAKEYPENKKARKA